MRSKFIEIVIMKETLEIEYLKDDHDIEILSINKITNPDKFFEELVMEAIIEEVRVQSLIENVERLYYIQEAKGDESRGN